MHAEHEVSPRIACEAFPTMIGQVLGELMSIVLVLVDSGLGRVVHNDLNLRSNA